MAKLRIVRWVLPFAALLLAAAVWLVACSPATPPTQKKWRVLAQDLPGGVVMSAVADRDATVLLVGGQSGAGALWRLKNGELKEETVAAGKLLTWASLGHDSSLLVVGNGQRALLRDPNGTWASENLPAGTEVWGCENLGNGNAYAVGADIDIAGQAAPVLLQRTPGGWSQVKLPGLSRPDVRLFKVAAHGPSNVVVVGDEGLALHYDGKVWQEEASTTGLNLTTVRAVEGGIFIAVGGQGSGVVIERDAAGKWHTLGLAQTGLGGFDWFGSAIWACGFGGWLENDALSPFANAPLDTPLTEDSLHFVLRLPNGDALAGGGNLAAWPGKMHGVVLKWSP